MCNDSIEERKKSDGINLPDGKEMRSLNECDGYKYLGVTEADKIKNKEMKEKVCKECKRRIRKILETKLSGENKRMEDIGINTRILELQETTIIHYVRIFRKVLEI